MDCAHAATSRCGSFSLLHKKMLLLSGFLTILTGLRRPRVFGRAAIIFTARVALNATTTQSRNTGRVCSCPNAVRKEVPLKRYQNRSTQNIASSTPFTNDSNRACTLHVQYSTSLVIELQMSTSCSYSLHGLVIQEVKLSNFFMLIFGSKKTVYMGYVVLPY